MERGSTFLARAPPAQALLRSQFGPRAAAWLGTVPSEAGTTIPPDRMLIALRRRLRLPLPVAQGRCGARGPGCGAAVDVHGDHYAACPRTGLLARRAKPLERAWIRVAREALGPEGQVVPQQWLVRTPAPGVDPDDRRRLDFVSYGATQLGEALCCDVTLVSPLARDGRPQPSSTTRDGAALAVAERRKRAAYPELLRRGPQRLCVLACETGGRWNDESLRLTARPFATCVLLLRSEELPLRAGTGGGGACSVWLCKTRLLPLCSGRRQSTPPCLARRRRICRTSCTTRARLCPAACRPAEPLQPAV